MHKNKAKNYILYARKSSEARERQEASLRDQISELQIIASREGLNIIEVIEESMSAKKPGRTGFNSLLQKIDSGLADGILCWKLNRLSRNPLDGAQIQWRLQQGSLKHVRTYSGNHFPEDNVLQVQVELGMANQFIKDLRVDVQRGMRQKAMRGWFPSTPPLGYLSRNKHVRKPGESEIIADPENFSKVRLLWDKFLTGKYTVVDIKNLADTLDLRFRNHKNTVSYNAISKMLSNKFYCGVFSWNDENGEKTQFEGKHEKMITLNQFQKAQTILGRNKVKSKIQVSKKELFVGCITCSICKGYYVVDRKFQVKCTECRKKFSALHSNKCTGCSLEISRMNKPWVLRRNYYRCSGKDKECKSIRFNEDKLLEMFQEGLGKLQIEPDFRDFYEKLYPIITQFFAKDENDELEVKIATLKKLCAQLERLSNAYLNGIYNDQEFGKKKVELTERKTKIKKEISMIQDQDSLMNEVIKNSFHKAETFGVFANCEIPDNLSIQELLHLTDSNLEIRGNELVFTGISILKELVKIDSSSQSFNLRLELKKEQNIQSRYSYLSSFSWFEEELNPL